MYIYFNLRCLFLFDCVSFTTFFSSYSLNAIFPAIFFFQNMESSLSKEIVKFCVHTLHWNFIPNLFSSWTVLRGMFSRWFFFLGTCLVDDITSFFWISKINFINLFSSWFEKENPICICFVSKKIIVKICFR